MKKKDDSEEVDEIVREILSYLADHPDAQDTLDGIMEWWLLDRAIKRQVKLVEGALLQLRDKGLILEKKSAGALPTYKINKKILEIKL